jgi:chaperonin GroEL
MKISTVGIPARDSAVKGANYLADAVKATLGPFGSDVLLEKQNKITNDGYTIAAAIAPTIENEFERRGALVFLQASTKTNDEVGDATTTAMTLAQAILKEAIKYLPKEGTLGSKKTASELRTQLLKEKEQVLAYLKSVTKTVDSQEDLKESALVSVENEELASMLAEAQWKLGSDGVIICEDSAEQHSQLEYIKGIKLDNGMVSTTTINNQEKGTLDVTDVPVILTNYTFHEDNDNFGKIKTVLEQLILSGKREIVLFGSAFSPNMVLKCLSEQQNGIFIFPMNAPYSHQKSVMRDIQAVVGGTFIEREEMNLEDITLSDVGHISSMSAGQWSTVIAGEKDPTERVKVLKQELKGTVSDFNKKLLETRIAQLENGCAVLKIGGKTELDRKKLKDKADDAVNSVRLALRGGTIRGAGIALKEAGESLPEGSLLTTPLASVYNQIVSSAPKDFVIEEWVRDPYITIESALNNAVSIATTFANIGAIVTEKDEKKVYVEGSAA